VPDIEKEHRHAMKQSDIRQFFRRLSEVTPDPDSELDYYSPYTLLVAVVLSAQSTDAGVNKATARLFPVADTPQDMVDLGVEGIKDYIKTLGLYNNKAESVYKLSQMLIEEHDGHVPATRKELERLPGVGRKTANVILNTAFGAPTIAVDTHIFRIANRTGLAPGKDTKAVENNLEKIVPDAYKRQAHHLLILHGRYVCKARKPECWRCPVYDLCEYSGKNA
jgi:endonuclease-3